MSEPPVLSALMPVYNEVATVDAAIDGVLAVDLALELVIVDDGSTDGTWDKVQARDDGHRVRTFQHPRNRGKGAAVRTALDRASGDYVVIQDADLEYDPQDYARLLDPIRTGRAEVVYGTRIFSSHSTYTYWYVMGNRFVTTAANIIYNRYITDMETCYKLMPRATALRLGLCSNGFEIDPEITAKLLRLGIRIYEVPIDYTARTHAEGKKIQARDGFKALATLARYRWWKEGR